ncbi:BTAD domain-containing putative transcriptional regulator [Dactylosporangium sp. NPDC048998]|uniref:AfsR/SARP family transcriptional regulator n=1 Tax=Dactylosporangium sp. NPDC048998 TaxID=3363976 RepID=UPI003719AB18
MIRVAYLRSRPPRVDSVSSDLGGISPTSGAGVRASMEFGILGPLTVTVDGRALHVGGLHSRLVLAGLLINAGRPVSVEQLIDLAWQEPPATVRQQVRNAVHRLRHLFDAHRDGREAASLRTVQIGYQLDLGDSRLDAEQFTAGLASARQLAANGTLIDAVAAFRGALGLWRGAALAGLPGAVLARHATGLEDLRLAAVEECAEAELRLGLHRRLIPELQHLLAEHPLRERFATLLMTALIQDGRRPDAIQVYHELVQRLRDELGIDPGEPLRDAYLEAIRTLDQPSPSPAEGETVPAGTATTSTNDPPRCLPRPPLRLIGREHELQQILAAGPALDRAGARSPQVVVIDGMAGVGKSALALTVAHAMADRFPDAHLFIDLHGHSEQQPVTTHEALGTLLRQLDLGRQAMPDSVPDRIALWRRRLHGRRGIVLLDNAARTAQIEPLLQLDGPSLILVTSRTRLAPIDGAIAVSLDLLDPRDAVALLRHTADQRVDDDPGAAAAIVELCGRLPLAIRLVGHRLRHRARWSAAMMQTQLATAARAPITISVEGHSTAAAFDLSYRQLSEPQQLLFRRLGLHPAGTLEVWAAAALADLPAHDTADLLDELVEVNLVQADIPGRYRLHDLIRAFAATLVTDQEHRPATLRMLDAYVQTLEVAGRHLETHRWNIGAPQPTARPGQAFSTSADGAAWAFTNWSTIVALVDIAEQAGAHRHAALLARMAYRSAEVFGLSTEALRLAERALAATEALGDDALTADTNALAGALYLRLGRHAECRACVERATHLYQRFGNDQLALSMQVNTTVLLRHEGRHLDAVRTAEAALSVARARLDRFLESRALVEGAAALHELGRHEQARRMLVDAAQDLRHRSAHALSIALGWLGSVHIALHQPDAAAIALLWAINLKRQHGNIGGAAEALSDYGRLLATEGNPEAALRYQRQAYEQVRTTVGDGYFEPIIANHLGETLTVLGRYDEAIAFHRRALREAEHRHWPYERARARAGIAAALRHSDPDEADVVRTQAITELVAIGLDPDTAYALAHRSGQSGTPAAPEARARRTVVRGPVST